MKKLGWDGLIWGLLSLFSSPAMYKFFGVNKMNEIKEGEGKKKGKKRIEHIWKILLVATSFKVMKIDRILKW